MIILGIESSCDDTAAALLEYTVSGDGKHELRLLSNSVFSQTKIHAEFGGVVPEIASRCHAENISSVVTDALKSAGLNYCDISAVAVTFAPGLIGSLLVGVSYAKALASALDVPIIPVDHIEAHAAAAYLEYPDIDGNYLALIVSGGHTSFYEVINYEFEEIGGTRDDACGEAFDKVGRVMGLPYPGGAAMDRLASEGFKRDGYKNIKFPSPSINDGTLEFSFSGLKTAVINHIHKTTQQMKLENGSFLPTEIKEDIAAAFTKVTVDGICSKLREALSESPREYIVLAGGVAANSHLRRGAEDLCRKMGVKLCAPSLSLCGDNGAMTAAAGAMTYRRGIVADSRMNAFASDDASKKYLNSLKHNLI